MNKTLLLAALAVVVPATPVAAQQGNLHVLIVTGLSGEPSFASTFATTASSIVEAATGPWQLPVASVTWLAEKTTGPSALANGKATQAAIDSAFARLKSTTKPGDVVVVFLIGHGSGSFEASRISLPGPDPTVLEYARWFDQLEGRTVVAIIAASASGDFLPILSHSGRIIVTATRSSTERNESLFGARFAHGLISLEADSDKDGLVSVLEAFTYAKREVAAAYDSDGRLMTEHAQLDDNGDGKGASEPGAEGVADGNLARRTTFGSKPTSSDPRVVALMDERQQLETQVEQLRRNKDSLAEADYLDKLETLLLSIAEKSRAIKQLSVGSSP